MGERDIVERLQDRSDHYLPDWARQAMDEAAAEITALRERCSALESQLQVSRDRNMASRQHLAAATRRADAMKERCAMWHDEQIEGGHCGESTPEIIMRQRRNKWHTAAATAIRAIDSEQGENHAG